MKPASIIEEGPELFRRKLTGAVSDDEGAGAGKTVGVVGGIIAAIGAVFAHGADDCARIGAKSAAFESAGVRAGSEVGKDFGRVGVQAGAAAERSGLQGASRLGALQGAGELGGLRAGQTASGAGDDVARVAFEGEIAQGKNVKLGAGATIDEAAHGGKWEGIADELGQNVVENGLELALDAPSVDEEDDEPLPKLAPTARAGSDVLAIFPAKTIGSTVLSAEPSKSAFLTKLVMPSRRAARFVVGYSASENSNALAMPDGSALPLSEIFARTAAVRVATFVLACDPAERTSPLLCAAGARQIADEVSKSEPKTAADAGRRLLEGRKSRLLETLTISTVAKVGETRRILTSRYPAK